MRNPIFTKAEGAAAILRESGHAVEVTTHPTPWGNSAYVTTRRSADGAYIQRGFRLSDHGVGDRRKEMDEVSTVIDGSDVSVGDLVEMAKISDASLARLRAEVAARHAKEHQREARRNVAAQEKAANDAARADYEAGMVAARKAFIAANYPEFDKLTKTKQRPIIKSFNKKYREGTTQ